MFSGACTSEGVPMQNARDIVKNPAKLCYVIQQCLREAAVGKSPPYLYYSGSVAMDTELVSCT